MNTVAERIRKRTVVRKKELKNSGGVATPWKMRHLRLYEPIHRDSREVRPVHDYPPIPDGDGVVNIFVIPSGKFLVPEDEAAGTPLEPVIDKTTPALDKMNPSIFDFDLDEQAETNDEPEYEGLFPPTVIAKPAPRLLMPLLIDMPDSFLPPTSHVLDVVPEIIPPEPVETAQQQRVRELNDLFSIQLGQMVTATDHHGWLRIRTKQLIEVECLDETEAFEQASTDFAGVWNP